jgi:type IV pilus assembly protein PilM
MDMKVIGERMERLIPAGVRDAAWMRPHYPLVAVELREDAVITVRLTRQRGQFHLGGYGHRALREGSFSPGLLKTQLEDPTAFVRAVIESLQLAGATGSARISLAVPDTIARVFVVDLEELPAASSQATEMIRWRIKKSIPFRVEDARLSWQPLGRLEDGRIQVLVAVAPDASLRPIEDLLTAAGLRVGLIDLSSFALLNEVRLDAAAGGAVPLDGDSALVNATPTYFSVTLVRGGRLALYRSKAYHVTGPFQGEESLRVVGRELKSTLSYYEEHLLGRGVTSTILRVAGLDTGPLAEVAREAGYGEVRIAGAPRNIPELRGLPDGTVPELLPAVGLALRRVS